MRLGAWGGVEEGGEFEDFDVVGAGGPVVAPADDQVASDWGVAVGLKIAALEFKFDVDTLPAIGRDQALGFAIGEAVLDGFDHVA